MGTPQTINSINTNDITVLQTLNVNVTSTNPYWTGGPAITNPVFTTYNIPATAITTNYFAIETIQWDPIRAATPLTVWTLMLCCPPTEARDTVGMDRCCGHHSDELGGTMGGHGRRRRQQPRLGRGLDVERWRVQLGLSDAHRRPPPRQVGRIPSAATGATARSGPTASCQAGALGP